MSSRGPHSHLSPPPAETPLGIPPKHPPADERARGAVADAIDQRELVHGFALIGLEVVELRTASTDEVAATHSSWAKRLGVGRNRSATILRAVTR